MKTQNSDSIGEVVRKLDKIERDGRAAWRLTVTRTYDTDVADAWDALTNAERIPRWFLPITGDLKVGGRYQFVGNAGGLVERCDPPHELALTWEMHGDVSWVTVRLSEQGSATRLTLEHVACVPEALFDQFGPGAVGIGWDLGMLGLSKHFETGLAMDAKEGAAWPLTPEGRAYVEACSAAWVEAWIDAGADPSKAQAAGARVTAFYSPPQAG